MRYTYPNGVTVDFMAPPQLTCIGNLSISELDTSFLHPHVIAQLDAMGFTPAGCLGSLKSWANRYERNILHSRYRESLIYMLEVAGLHYNRDERTFEYASSRFFDEYMTPMLVRGPSSNTTGQDHFVLLDQVVDVPAPDVDEQGRPLPGGTFKHYSISHRHGGLTLVMSRIPSEPEPSQPSEWERVMNYTFTPSNMPFLTCEHEKTEMFFGMELELSSNLSPLELQRINDTVEPVRERWFYFKQDSSVTGSKSWNMEMVTVPMTPKRMRREWKILFEKIQRLSAQRNVPFNRLFDCSTNLNNGIHIHVNKTAFVQSSHTDHRHKFRFITAFNQWESSMLDWLQKVSKRPTPLRDNRYCYVHPGLDGRTLARRLRDGPTHADRHAACHEGNATVEVRIFQGIVDLSHILSCVDFTEAMFEFTQYAPHSAYGARFPSVFSDFVFQHHRYKNAKEVLAQCA